MVTAFPFRKETDGISEFQCLKRGDVRHRNGLPARAIGIHTSMRCDMTSVLSTWASSE